VRGPLEAASAEGAKELLSAMTGEQQPDHDSKCEQSEFHLILLRSGVINCLPRQQRFKHPRWGDPWVGGMTSAWENHRDASADQPRRAVPGAGELTPDRPRGGPDDPGSLDDEERGAHLQGHPPVDGGAPAAAPAASLAPGGGAVRPRLSLLARRPALRP